MDSDSDRGKHRQLQTDKYNTRGNCKDLFLKMDSKKKCR